MIRVLICDDQDIVREGLKIILETDSEIEVVGMVEDGQQGIEAAALHQPDIILMDLKMPVLNGIHATREIHTRHPDIHIIVLTTFDGDEWVFDAIRSGASGYLLKDTPREQLIKAVKETVKGKTFVDPDVAGKLFQQIARRKNVPESSALNSLNERERDILKLIAQGLSNPEIAERLFLSEGTIRNAITTIFAKINVTDRTQAALMAVRYGLAD